MPVENPDKDEDPMPIIPLVDVMLLLLDADDVAAELVDWPVIEVGIPNRPIILRVYEVT